MSPGYVKRGDSPTLDVAMSCYDGAEICELVGLYILHKLSSAYRHGSIGLFWDGGLALFKNANDRSPRPATKSETVFYEILGDLGLKITVQSNLNVVKST